ncbi:MAG: zinc-ribbon domain-containing protein [Candidatus Helarchaeota archaeon]
MTDTEPVTCDGCGRVFHIHYPASTQYRLGGFVCADCRRKGVISDPTGIWGKIDSYSKIVARLERARTPQVQIGTQNVSNGSIGVNIGSLPLKCWNCGHNNQPGSQFCNKCGSQL